MRVPAVILGKTIVELDPGDVAYYALGWSGFVIVIVAGWTTAITNLYRAGLAAQGIFYNHSRKNTTLAVGLAMVVIACFPFVFSQILPAINLCWFIGRSCWRDYFCRASAVPQNRIHKVLV